MDTNNNEDYLRMIDEVVRLVASAKRIVFLTGAGISSESGLPTYRGVGGLYNDMTVDENLPIEVVLSGPMFASRPEVTWKYIAEIERACRGAKPNGAHYAIQSLEAYTDVWTVTQNVDGFHHDAGSTNVIEMHGNLSDLSCTVCDKQTEVSDYSEIAIPPICPECQGLMRPSVVLFEEMLPDVALARYELLFREGFDVIFSVGTTAGFPYIYEPVAQAKRIGIPTIEINPDNTPLSEIVDYKFATGAGTVLKSLVEKLSATLH